MVAFTTLFPYKNNHYKYLYITKKPFGLRLCGAGKISQYCCLNSMLCDMYFIAMLVPVHWFDMTDQWRTLHFHYFYNSITLYQFVLVQYPALWVPSRQKQRAQAKSMRIIHIHLFVGNRSIHLNNLFSLFVIVSTITWPIFLGGTPRFLMRNRKKSLSNISFRYLITSMSLIRSSAGIFLSVVCVMAVMLNNICVQSRRAFSFFYRIL